MQTTQRLLYRLVLLVACLWLPLQLQAQDSDELQLGVQGKGMTALTADRFYYVSGDTCEPQA